MSHLDEESTETTEETGEESTETAQDEEPTQESDEETRSDEDANQESSDDEPAEETRSDDEETNQESADEEPAEDTQGEDEEAVSNDDAETEQESAAEAQDAGGDASSDAGTDGSADGGDDSGGATDASDHAPARSAALAVTRAGSTAPSSVSWAEYIDGGEIPADVIAAIRKARARYPALPLKEIETGKFAGTDHYQYFHTDAEHKKYLLAYLQKKIDAGATRADRFAATALRALLGREGSSADWNTYDNQVVTWGVGMSGLALLPGKGLSLMNKDATLKERLREVGFAWDDKKGYRIVDVDEAKVVSSVPGKVGEAGHGAPCRAWRRQKDLLSALTGISVAPDTRDAVTEAMYGAFKWSSAGFDCDAVKTQALFNFVSHLHHWMVGWAKPAWAEALNAATTLSTLSGLSDDRDVELAKRMARGFYRRSQCNKAQLLGYWRDMKKDGLASLPDTVDLDGSD